MSSGILTEDSLVADTGFVCDLCSKVFDRNDLLNRHKRRCKTINRSSKRKACSACVRSKSKCCFTHPRCQRCVKRGELCEYPSHGLTPMDHAHLSQPISHSQTMEASTSQVLPGSVVPSIAPDPLSDLDWVWDYNMVDESPHPQVDGLQNQSDSLSYQAHPLGARLGASLDSATFAPSNYQRSDVLDRSDLEVLSADTIPETRIRLEHQNGFSMNHSLPSQVDMASYSDTSLGRSKAQTLDTQRTGAAHISAQRSSLTAATLEGSVDRISASRGYRTESGDDSSFRSSPSVLTSTPSSSIETVAPQISNTEDLLALVKNYPRLLLQNDHRSPFFHHKLYSGPFADMSVLAKSGMAVCCAAAYENANSVEFVSKFIVTERERLVHNFHRYSCIEEWDALHAMCIYQIIELLDSRKKDAESKMKAAELHIPFLLKMTRQFSRNHASANKSEDLLEDNWQRWFVAETVRRTIFLVNIINVLAGHDNGCPSPYYEPLDDDLIFRMALPAPDALWESRTAEAWQAARNQLGWLGSKRSTIKRLQMDNFREIAKENWIGSPGLTNSRELTNLILNCHVHDH